MTPRTVSILGTEYTVQICSPEEEKLLTQCDGFCDKTTHRIAVTTKPEDCDLDDFATYQRKVIRHEVIHAFLFESGLDCNINRAGAGTVGNHDEQMVDWMAAQWPKICRVFEALGVSE